MKQKVRLSVRTIVLGALITGVFGVTLLLGIMAVMRHGHAGGSQNAVSRFLSRFQNGSTGEGANRLVISPVVSSSSTVDCLALPVQDEQGLIWCIRKDRPSDLACWDGQQWRYAELPGIAADPRGPAGAAILVDDADRVLVISAGGPAEFSPGEIDVDALEAEYRQEEYLFVDKGLISRLEQKSRASKGRSAYRISSLSPGDVAGIFSPMLRRYDLCSLVNIQRLGLGSSYLVQKVRTCDNNSSTEMIVTANKLLLSKIYPRTFAKSFREKAYRLKRSSLGAVEIFPDSLTLLTDSVRSGSKIFRENANHPPLVYKKKIIYDGKCFGSDTLHFVYVDRDAITGTWKDNLVAIEFANAAAGAEKGKTVPSKCLLCGDLSNGVMRAVYEDAGKPQKQPKPAGSAAVLAGNTVKLPAHVEGIYPFKGGFSYFDPASESIVLCSSGGVVSEIRMNEGLIGRTGIQVFDDAVYGKNKDTLFLVRKSSDGVRVFTSRDDFDRSLSTGAVQVNAVKLPGYIENVYPVPGGFAVNDHQAGRITVYLKDRVIETDAAFYKVNQLNKNSALFADAKGNLWINTDGRFIELLRDEVFAQK